MSRFKKVLPIAGFIWVIVYFAYHAFTGEQGLRNLLVYKQQEARLEQQLSQLKSCRGGIEKRIAMLSDDSLDLDYLEERAHSVLALTDPRDVFLTYKTKPNAQRNNAALSCADKTMLAYR